MPNSKEVILYLALQVGEFLFQNGFESDIRDKFVGKYLYSCSSYHCLIQFFYYLDKGIDGFVFISLTVDDLTQMGLKIRPKKEIVSLIASILCEANEASHQPT